MSSLEPFLGGDQAIVELLAVGHLRCTSWPLLMLDLVSVSVGLWWGKRDRRRVSRRYDGGFVVRGEQGVVISVVICINKGKMPFMGSTRVVPALKDGGA